MSTKIAVIKMAFKPLLYWFGVALLSLLVNGIVITHQVPERSLTKIGMARDNGRRQAISAFLSFCVVGTQIESAVAEQDTEAPEAVVIRGRVILGSDVDLDASQFSGAALYITCRPDKPDDVPAAILNGSRGKPPPVLSARFENPTFPFDFALSVPRDLTPEGASDGKTSTLMLNPADVWWKETNLIVSARWDSDGVVSTRSPEDLVARGISTRPPGTVVSTTELQLTGRGAFGKFATGAKKAQ